MRFGKNRASPFFGGFQSFGTQSIPSASPNGYASPGTSMSKYKSSRSMPFFFARAISSSNRFSIAFELITVAPAATPASAMKATIPPDARGTIATPRAVGKAGRTALRARIRALGRTYLGRRVHRRETNELGEDNVVSATSWRRDVRERARTKPNRTIDRVTKRKALSLTNLRDPSTCYVEHYFKLSPNHILANLAASSASFSAWMALTMRGPTCRTFIRSTRSFLYAPKFFISSVTVTISTAFSTFSIGMMVWPLCWVAAARSAAGLSPFFGLEFLRGNKINLALYSSRRFLLSCEQENQTKSVSRSSTFALRGQIRPRARARRVNMAVYGGDPKSLRDNRRVGHTACERHVPLKTPRCGYGVGDQRKYRSSGRASSGCQPPARGKGKIRVSLTTLAVRARTMAITRTFNSSSVKPRPRRVLKLYRCVGGCTIGRSAPATGRGNVFFALSSRALRRDFLRPAARENGRKHSRQPNAMIERTLVEPGADAALTCALGNWLLPFMVPALDARRKKAEGEMARCASSLPG
ncbi:hypothetical protein BE221DRAFT_69486 [Ostreococcus tauri]|uniref:Uncharacterized protein n=1 Tax=Ostreococcus tauri TaxID=70448 RepID=A0A1Y5IDW2_OSTTA|nr:hypothetical protein BE221DRAFT_69486 [Ostreococcus tauri]